MKFLAALLLALSGAPSSAAEAPADLVVYAYDSFAAKHGLGPAIVPVFEKTCGCKVSVLPSGDGGQVINRVKLDQGSGRTGAHVMIGIDQSTWERAAPLSEPWGDWKPKGLEKVSGNHRVHDGFLPFDYGVFALMADSAELEKRHLDVPASISLQKLIGPEFKRQLLLEDPRTSTPGLAFLLYTFEVQKKWDWWKSFTGQPLSYSRGWDEAYGLFLKGEAPFVWSYVTSQAYHREHGDPSRYRAVLFDEGNPIQVEGAALVKGALRTERERKLAHDFLEFLLSPEVQKRIPQANWMYPVVEGTEVPKSFAELPQVKKTVKISSSESKIKQLLTSWGRVLHGGKP